MASTKLPVKASTIKPETEIELFKALSEFVKPCIPGCGYRNDGSHLCDDDTPSNVLIARDDAIIASLETITSIANRYNFPS